MGGLGYFQKVFLLFFLLFFLISTNVFAVVTNNDLQGCDGQTTFIHPTEDSLLCLGTNSISESPVCLRDHNDLTADNYKFVNQMYSNVWYRLHNSGIWDDNPNLEQGDTIDVAAISADYFFGIKFFRKTLYIFTRWIFFI